MTAAVRCRPSWRRTAAGRRWVGRAKAGARTFELRGTGRESLAAILVGGRRRARSAKHRRKG